MHTPTGQAAESSSDFVAFFNAARPKLLRVLMRSEVPPEDAEDLVHSAVVTLLNYRHLDGVVCTEAWLFGTLRVTILRYWQGRKREREFLARLARELVASEPAPQERQDSARDLEALTADLPERDLEILWVRYGLGLKPREAAAFLGCQPDSVRKLCRRALERVRRRLPQAPAAMPPRGAPDNPPAPPLGSHRP